MMWTPDVTEAVFNSIQSLCFEDKYLVKMRLVYCKSLITLRFNPQDLLAKIYRLLS